jgi:hypothetical protein
MVTGMRDDQQAHDEQKPRGSEWQSWYAQYLQSDAWRERRRLVRGSARAAYAKAAAKSRQARCII